MAWCSSGCDTAVNPEICKLGYINTVTLTGLQPKTIYHYAAVGKDLAGNVAVTNPKGSTAHDWYFSTSE
jgi:hypothetical protein